VKRGEIRWYTFRVPDKRRPILILTRNEVIDRLNEIIVVPVTRTIRGPQYRSGSDNGRRSAGNVCAEFGPHFAGAARSHRQCHLQSTRIWMV
jgi:mRNA-degrading endonuclease toxin of MazEF toxin-antitoxin module